MVNQVLENSFVLSAREYHSHYSLIFDGGLTMVKTKKMAVEKMDKQVVLR